MLMAKKKEPIEEIKAEDVMVESVEVETVSEPDFADEFIAKQLMAINRLSDRALAKRNAERVLRNRKG